MNLGNLTISMAGARRVGPGALRDYIVLEEHRAHAGLIVRRIAAKGSPVASAVKRARLALSASATRPPADDEVADLFDRLARGLGQLKRMTDRAQPALVRDAERRRVAWAERKLRR